MKKVADKSFKNDQFLWKGFNCLKAVEPLQGDNSLFTTKFPEVPYYFNFIIVPKINLQWSCLPAFLPSLESNLNWKHFKHQN